ncbi:hypothetical protein PAXRUDRAFT_83776, partial [Paxillus rubicundulus Ve08.2h10]
SWRMHSKPAIKGGDSVRAMVALLAAARENSKSYDPLTWTQQIKALFYSLESIVMRCGDFAIKDVSVSFLLMVNFIQLVTSCQSIRQTMCLTPSEVFEQQIKPLNNNHNLRVPCQHTFLDWHAMGCKFAAVAGGGSIYVLVLIAGLGLRVGLSTMDDDTPWDLANVLRSPNSGNPIGRLVIEQIIPTIRQIHDLLPLSMVSMFTPSLLFKYGLPSNLDCTDLTCSDTFFDSLIFNVKVSPGAYIRIPASLLKRCGDSAPKDVQPGLLERDNMCTNYSQIVPYTSAELKMHKDLYPNVEACFTDMFSYSSKMIEHYLLSEHTALAEVAGLLPGHTISPAHPFCALVINVNVCTLGHRDSKDKDICKIMAIGRYVGGEVVL